MEKTSQFPQKPTYFKQGTGNSNRKGAFGYANSTNQKNNLSSPTQTNNSNGIYSTGTNSNFSLPSAQAQNQKNAFEIDIDSLEEKPWRKPGKYIYFFDIIYINYFFRC